MFFNVKTIRKTRALRKDSEKMAVNSGVYFNIN